MNKNKYFFFIFFLSAVLFSSQNTQAMRIDECTAVTGRTCETSCAAVGKSPNPGDSVCDLLWPRDDQQCCVPAALPACNSVPGQFCTTGCTNPGEFEVSGFNCSGLKCCGGGAGGAGGAGGGDGSSVSVRGLEYQLLEKIPGTDGLGSDLPGYVNAIYRVALIVVTLSAVLMLSIGGFMYLTSAGNTAAMGTAKGIIYDSIIGLVIALSAWLILYIINPDLVKISLTALPPVTVTSTPGPTAGGIDTLPQQDTISLAAEILTIGRITLQGDAQASCGTNDGTKVSVKRNIEDVAAGKTMRRCSKGCGPTSGCMNFSGISNTMLRAIKAVGQTHSFTITSIGGGSHANNSVHYSGRGIDIAPVTQALLDAFVAVGAAAPRGNAASMCEKNGINVGCAPGSGANHIHLVFPN